MADHKTEIDETAASETIQAHGVVSRSELLAQMLSATASIPTPALVDFCAAALAFANDPGAKHGGDAPAASESNKASVSMKGSSAASGQPGMPVIQAVREDLDVVLSAQELPAEAVEKVLTLFESAVSARLHLEIARIEEAHEGRLAEETEKLSETIETYLDAAAEKFFEENEVAIESAIKIELYEEFMGGLASLFREHWVDIPEDKLDVVEELSARVSELEDEINNKAQEVLDLEDELLATSAKRVFSKVTEGMTDTDREKLKVLSESVEFDGDEETLESRIKTIKDAHFKTGAKNVSEKKPIAPKAAMIAEGEVVTVHVDDNLLDESDPLVAALSRLAPKR